MKIKIHLALGLALLSTLNPQLSTLHAQVPQLIGYQGLVQVLGTNFNGTGQFKFALISSGSNMSARAMATAMVNSGFITAITVTSGGSGYTTVPAVTITDPTGTGAQGTAQLSGGSVSSITVDSAGSGYSPSPTVTIAPPPDNFAYRTYWSNNGSSTDGSEPTAHVELAVTGGLFKVLLGDTTLANMTPVPYAVFTNGDVHLRIWFNDGVNGFARLTNDVRIAAAGYAMMAAAVADGAVTSAKLAPNAVTAGVIQDSTITAAKLATGAAVKSLNGLTDLVTLSPGANITLTPSGNSIQISSDGGGSATNAWTLTGNSGTTPGTHFIGTTDNQPLELKVNGLRALRIEDNGDSASDSGTTPDGAPNLIAGSPRNFVGAGVVGATIAGGGATNFFGNAYTNSVLADFGVVGGGRQNTIATNSRSATIAGGGFNNIGTNSFYSAIGGGYFNYIAANSSVATIAGGESNDIRTNADYSAIGGGYDNNIAADSPYAAIAGGVNNDIGTNSYSSAIGGGTNNNIAANSFYATIAGGVNNDIGTTSDSSAIGGGTNNNIAANSPYATIAGGFGNISSGFSATVGGGEANNSSSDWATVAGGIGNLSSGAIATVGGGSGNISSGVIATVGGGNFNTSRGSYATVGGGSQNSAGGESSTVGGGGVNIIGTNAHYSTIGGGEANTISNNIEQATIPGGNANTVGGHYGFAAGRSAKANHAGSFVWADSSNFDFASTAGNQFNVRAVGGVRIVTGIDGSGVPDAGMSLNADDSSWNVISDRAAKKNFRPADRREILERLAGVPIQRWNYKWEADDAVPHLGPTAQDFKAAFYPGRDDKTISTLEADGVALAAIQGLNQKVEAGGQRSEVRIQKLEVENAELKARLDKLEQLLNHKLNGGAK